MTDINPLDELEPRRKKKSGKSKGPTPPSSGGGASDESRPVIDIIGGELPAIVDAGEQALITAGADIYQSGGRLVTIGHADKGNRPGAKRPAGAPRLVPVTAVHLRERMTAAAQWRRYDARSQSMRDIDCPLSVAAALIDRGSWAFRELVAFIEAPTVREDGTPILAPGYDADSGLYLVPGAPAVTLPELLDKATAEAAADQLVTALESWPYVHVADHAAAVAMMMTMLYARSVDAVPMACVTAPTPGTGKSLLVDATATNATGRRAAVISLGKDPAEAGKRLSAGLLQGDSPLAADNVETALGDELLCQAVTQPYLSIRPLGSSVSVRVPARTALCATGNNLTVKGDLTRRVMMIRLDAGMERPETRRFEGNVLDDIAARRTELIAAALTVTLAYHAAGCPAVQADPLGGFEHWERLVRYPLIWVGLPDPLAPTAEVRAEDPDRTAMVALYAAMHDFYGDRTVTAADIILDAQKVTPRYAGDGFDPDHPDLHDAVRQACGARVDAQRLGLVLRRYAGRIADGLRLDRMARQGRNKVAGWRVVPLSISPPTGTPVGGLGGT